MKRCFALSVLVLTLAAVSCKDTPKYAIDYVDPFIGTGFHGHTYPGATTPFGAVQLSPDNYRDCWDACSGYHYDRDSIAGFSHTHLSGTGCADLGDILFHPSNHDVDLSREGEIYEHLKYRHKDECAEPGYYSVYFKDERLKAEMTATRYTGWHRYTFCKGMPHVIVVDMSHSVNPATDVIKEIEIEQTSPNEIRGMKVSDGWTPGHHIYFVARFSHDIETIRYVDDHKFVEGPGQCTSLNRQAVLTFKDGGGPVIAKVALSQVSYEGAENNLFIDTGMYNFNFDSVRDEARDDWSSFLSSIEVAGGTEAERRTFYTALYHTAIVPNLTSDQDGRFRRNDGSVAKAVAGKTYSTLSLWDIFRAWLPLSSFVYPQVLHDVVFSCLDMYQATGELPIWPLGSGETYCMIGYHSVPFIVSAWFKGLVPEMNVDFALKAMVESSNRNEKGSSYYSTLGFIPSNKMRESVSAALEYAYDDWCIARFAEATGKKDIAEEYYRRANNFVHNFDGSTGFLRGRNLDGSMVDPFNPFETSREYTEANAWQYRFFVPQDVKGFCDLLGGEDKFIEALDGLFNAPSEIAGHVADMTGFVGQYVHGNEPSHHITYLYNYVGQPWKTQELTRRMLDEMYDDTPSGISGNEDCGQMSAWYVMSAMGLYEVCPGSLQFLLTTPLFEKVTFQMPSGHVVRITANNPSVNRYIQSVELNGQTLDRCYITYDELMKGADINFVLGKKPNKELWTSKSARPYSLTGDEPLVSPVWYTIEGGRIDLFLDKLTMTLGTLTEGAEIHYTLDGSDPTSDSPLYKEPLVFDETTTVSAKAFKDGRESILFRTTVRKCHYLPASKESPSANGLSYKYYKGDFSRTDDILKSGTFIKEGTLAKPELTPAEDEDYYGFIYKGYINVPETKVWNFAMLCDDGGLLQIDGNDVVDNDGTHSAAMMRGFVPLEAGMHQLTLKYIESYEDQVLKVFWENGDKFEEIPAEAYFLGR